MFGLIRKSKVQKEINEEIDRIFGIRSESSRKADNFWEGAVWSLNQFRKRIK